MMSIRARAALTLALLFPCAVTADTTDAACVVYPAGSDQASATLACSFSQRQGFITIRRADGVEHDLRPAGDKPGVFMDQDGGMAYRQSGLGDQGLIFRFNDESVYVYWSTSMLEARDSDNPTWPFTTADYDATTLLSCRATGASSDGQCPAGILRMEGGQASIVVRGPGGDEFTINFLADGVNATNRELAARREGDLWILEFANGEVWQVPLAAIEGG